MDLRAELIRFVNEEISLDPTRTIVGDTDLLFTGLVDSLSVIEIVGWLEDRLDVEIDPLEITLKNFRTIDSMTSFATGLQDATRVHGRDAGADPA